jgi:hypothetical protein
MAESNERQIETFIWKGQTRYKCPENWESGAKCEYNCASMDQLVAHMKSPHLRAAPVTTPPQPYAVPVEAADTERAAPEFKGATFATEPGEAD